MNKLTDVQKKRRFNFADVIIIVVLLIIVTLLAKLFVGNFSDYIPSTDNLEYTVEVEQMHSEIYSLFSVGQSVFDSETGNEIGTISKMSVSPSVYSDYDVSSGEYVHYYYPDLLDVRITIVSPYKETGLRFNVNGVEIKTGKQLGFITDTAYAEGVIVDVKTINTSAPDIYTPNSADSISEMN